MWLGPYVWDDCYWELYLHQNAHGIPIKIVAVYGTMGNQWDNYKINDSWFIEHIDSYPVFAQARQRAILKGLIADPDQRS